MVARNNMGDLVMDWEKNVIVRHGPPNKYDHAPMGSKLYVIVNDKQTEIYIQRSAQEDEPQWELVEE